MKITGKNSLSSIFSVVIIVSLVLGAVLIVALPFIYCYLPGYRWIFYFFESNMLASLILLEVCGVIFWLIVNEGRKIFNTMRADDPFNISNAVYLKRIAYMCLLLFIAFIVKMIFDFSPLTPVIAVVFLIVSMLMRILSGVFHKAAQVKSENDLTI